MIPGICGGAAGGRFRPSHPQNGGYTLSNELVQHIKEELKHVHADIEHVGRDLEELTSHLRNLDEHLHHLMDEAETGAVREG